MLRLNPTYSLTDEGDDVSPTGGAQVAVLRQESKNVVYAGPFAELGLEPLLPRSHASGEADSSAYDILLIGAGCSVEHSLLKDADIDVVDCTKDGDTSDAPGGLGTYCAGLVAGQPLLQGAKADMHGFAPRARVLVHKVISRDGSCDEGALDKSLRAALELKVSVIVIAIELDDAIRELPSLSLHAMLEQLAHDPERVVVVSMSLGKHMEDLVVQDLLFSAVGYDSHSSVVSIQQQYPHIQRSCNILAPAEGVWSLHHQAFVNRHGRTEWGYRKLSGNVVAAVMVAAVAARVASDHRVALAPDGVDFKAQFKSLIRAGVLNVNRHCCSLATPMDASCAHDASSDEEADLERHSYNQPTQAVTINHRNSIQPFAFDAACRHGKDTPYMLDWLLEYQSALPDEQRGDVQWRGLLMEFLDEFATVEVALEAFSTALKGLHVPYSDLLVARIVPSVNQIPGSFDVLFTQLFTNVLNPWQLVYRLEQRVQTIRHTDLFGDYSTRSNVPVSPSCETVLSDFFGHSALDTSHMTGSGVRVAVIGAADCHSIDGKRIRPDLGLDCVRSCVWTDMDGYRRSCCVHGPTSTATSGGEEERRQATLIDVIHSIAPDAELVPIRVSLPSPGKPVTDMSTRNVVCGIYHALAQGCHIILLNVKGVGSRTLRRAIRHAVSKNVLLVAPAGDLGSVDDRPHDILWPARYHEVVAVGGCEVDGSPWQLTGKGRQVDVCTIASGVKVHDTDVAVSSTAISAAAVAALAAIWREKWALSISESAFLADEDQDVNLTDVFQYTLAQLRVVRPSWSQADCQTLCGLLDQSALPMLQKSQFPSAAELATFNRSPEGGRVLAPRLIPILGLDLLRMTDTLQEELSAIAVTSATTINNNQAASKVVLDHYHDRLCELGSDLFQEAAKEQGFHPVTVARTTVEPVTRCTFVVSFDQIILVDKNTNLTKATGAPPAMPHLSICSHEEHVYYIGKDGSILELYLMHGKWEYNNLTALFNGPEVRSHLGPASFFHRLGRGPMHWVVFVSQVDRRIHFFHYNRIERKKQQALNPQALGWAHKTVEHVPRVHADSSWFAPPSRSTKGNCISFIAEGTGQEHHICLFATRCDCPYLSRYASHYEPVGDANLTPVPHHVISDEDLPAMEAELSGMKEWIRASRSFGGASLVKKIEELAVSATVEQFDNHANPNVDDVLHQFKLGFYAGLYFSQPAVSHGSPISNEEKSPYGRGFRAALESVEQQAANRKPLQYGLHAEWTEHAIWGDLVQFETSGSSWLCWEDGKTAEIGLDKYSGDLFPLGKVARQLFQVHRAQQLGWVLLKASNGCFIRVSKHKLLADAPTMDAATPFNIVDVNGIATHQNLKPTHPVGTVYLQVVRPDNEAVYVRSQFGSVKADRSKAKGCETYRMFVRQRIQP